MKYLRPIAVRCVSALLALSIVGSVAYAPIMGATPKAHAYLGVLDSNVTDVATLAYYAASEAAQADTALNTTGELLISKILNGIAWAVAKAVIQSMTRSIVTWINSGFHGSPAFATDLKQTMRQLGDGIAAGFVQGLLDNVSINSPYLTRAVGLVARGYLLYTSRDAIAQRLQYTLGQYSQNEEAFRRGQFNQGGFNAWLATTRQCGNDPYCVQYAAQEELVNRIDSAARQQLQELDWGRGFLSWKTCEESGAASDAEGAPGTSVELNDANTSSNCTVNTPGSVIETQLEQQLGTGLRQLELADSINEIVGALASQLVSKVLSSTGLLGASQPSSGGGRSYLEQATAPDQTGGSSLSSGFKATVEAELAKTNSNRAKWIEFKALASEAVAACALPLHSTPQETEANAALTQANSMLARADALIPKLTTIVTRLNETTDSTTPAAYSALAQTLTTEYNEALASGSVTTPPDLIKTRLQQIISGHCI